MFVLGIILFIIGVVMLLMPIPLPNKDPIGWLLAAVGLILVLVALLVTNVDVSHAMPLPYGKG